MNDAEKAAFDRGRGENPKTFQDGDHEYWGQGIEADYADLRGNASKNRQRTKSKPSNCDLSSLSRDRDAAIAEINRQASEAKDIVEREYRLAVAKVADDLKRACSEIRRADKLKNKKPTVTRTEAKSRVRSEKITPESLLNRLELFDGCCAYCSEPLGKNKQADHVVPISKLGADTLANIVFVCQSCNSSKGNRDFLGWYRSKPFWTQERESKVLSITGKLDALKI